MTALTEAEVEEAALAWLRGLGRRTVHGPAIAPDSPRVLGRYTLEPRLPGVEQLYRSVHSRCRT